MNLLEKVKEILLEVLDISEADVVGEALVIDDLGATSVQLVEIVAAIENEFDLNIPDEQVQSVRTVQDIVDYLALALGG